MGYYANGKATRVFGTRSEAIRFDTNLEGTSYTEVEPNAYWAWYEGRSILYHSRGTPEGYKVPKQAFLRIDGSDPPQGKMATAPALTAGDAVSWEDGEGVSHGIVKEICNDGSILTDGGNVILSCLDAVKKGWKVEGSLFTFATEKEAQFLANSYNQRAALGYYAKRIFGVVPCDVLEYDYFIWADPKTGDLLNSTQGYLPPYAGDADEDEWYVKVPAHEYKSKPATFNYSVKHFKTKAEADFYNEWAKEGCPDAVGVHSPYGGYYLVWDYIHDGQVNWDRSSDSRSGALPPSKLDWVVRTAGPGPLVKEPLKVSEAAGIGKGTFLALALGVLSLSLLAKKKPSRVRGRVLPELRSDEEVELERAEGVSSESSKVYGV
jgi:hypothetical protein